jgi:hypothetical protein
VFDSDTSPGVLPINTTAGRTYDRKFHARICGWTPNELREHYRFALRHGLNLHAHVVLWEAFDRDLDLEWWCTL